MLAAPAFDAFDALLPSPYAGAVFRNIYTCAPSQSLFSDICDPEDETLLDAVVQESSGVEHQSPQFERPFQYGQVEDDEVFAVFRQERWAYSRFSDGYSYGVWYSAEDALTSIYESAWWAYRLAADNVLKRGEVYTSDRAMFQARVRTERAVDLMEQKDWRLRLSHPNDYSFCHELGNRALAQGWELVRTPSARRAGGVCVPIFARSCIESAQFSYYLRFHIGPDGMICVGGANADLNFSFRHAAQG